MSVVRRENATFCAAQLTLGLALLGGVGCAPGKFEGQPEAPRVAAGEKAPDFADAPTRADEDRTSSLDVNSGSGQPAVRSTPPPVATSNSNDTSVVRTFGVNKNLSCDEYLATNWRLGAKVIERAPAPRGTSIVFTATVTAVAGRQVTMTVLTDLPRGDDLTETYSFDACSNGSVSAVPPTAPTCPSQEMGRESIVAGGVTYDAVKVQLGPCTDSAGKTFTSLVWRAANIPLWGVVKREVTGTYVSDALNNRLTALSESFTF